MSGINTLIDTLLHSVLGKRVDVPPPKELNEPVRPISVGHAPLAVRSDSRLETSGIPLRELPQSGGKAARPPSQPIPQAPLSTETRFSPAARAIAELLARFPSPPSVLASSAALMTTGDSPDPATLAARLQASIGESGLFYEHHLQRWYRGDLSLPQLAREPQMQWQQSQLAGTQAGPVPTTPAGAPSASATRSPVASTELYTPLPSVRVGLREGHGSPREASAPQPVSGSGSGATAPPSPLAPSRPEGVPGGMGEGGTASVEREVATSEARPVGLPESLQGIVRHQLELLSTPVLRWEGDIWSGLFLALLIQGPAQPWHEETGSGLEEKEEDESQSWRSELRLEVSGLGELRARIHLAGNRVEVSLTAQTLDMMSRLEAGKEELIARLQRNGLVAPQVRVLLQSEAARRERGEGDSDR